MTRLGASLAAVGRWLSVRVDARDLEFYGGLLLLGVGAGRWPIVGAVLAAHAWFGPLMAARSS